MAIFILTIMCKSLPKNGLVNYKMIRSTINILTIRSWHHIFKHSKSVIQHWLDRYHSTLQSSSMSYPIASFLVLRGKSKCMAYARHVTFACYELVSYSGALWGRVRRKKYLPRLILLLIRRGWMQGDKFEYMIIFRDLPQRYPEIVYVVV